MRFSSSNRFRLLLPIVAIATATGIAVALERQTASFATQSPVVSVLTSEHLQELSAPLPASNGLNPSAAETQETPFQAIGAENHRESAPHAAPDLDIDSLLIPNDVSASLDCSDPHEQWQMNQCATLEYQRVDENLNRTYSQLKKALQPSLREQLRATAAAWIEHRNAVCTFERSRYKGGSIEPLIFYSCMTRETEAQINYFQEQLEMRQGQQ